MDPLATAMANAATAAPPTQQNDAWAMALWHIFANTAAAVNGKLDGGIQAMITAQQGGLNALLVIAAGVLLAHRLSLMVLQAEGNPISLFLLTAMRYAIILTFVNASYNQYIANTLTQLPTQIGNGLLGAVGGAAFQGADAFDNAFNSLWAAANICYENGPDSYKIVFLAIALVIAVFIGGIMILATFVVWLAADIVLKLGIALGPMFIAAALTPATKGLTDNWIGVTLTAVAAQVLVLLVLGLIGFAEGETTNQIIAAKSQAGGNVMVQLQGIIIFTIVMAVLGITAYTQVPSLAAKLMHGVTLHIAGYTAAAMGTAALGLAAAGRAAALAETAGATARAAITGGSSSTYRAGSWASSNIGRGP
jgi:type IV secretion system protein VirB6